MKQAPLFAVALLATALAQGCATREYGRQNSLSSYESSAMSCGDIEQEMTRTVSFVEQLNKGEERRWYDVPALMGDHWIGNRMEKSAALESANTRMVQLWGLRDSKKCGGTATTQPLSLPVQKPEVEEHL